ncbi:hypothetical protein LguiB_025277 [Lonicera macranthoides]
MKKPFTISGHLHLHLRPPPTPSPVTSLPPHHEPNHPPLPPPLLHLRPPPTYPSQTKPSITAISRPPSPAASSSSPNYLQPPFFSPKHAR